MRRFSQHLDLPTEIPEPYPARHRRVLRRDGPGGSPVAHEEGHDPDRPATAAADAVGILPLAIGSALLYWLLRSRRFQLGVCVSARSATAVAAVFISGLGLGLLLASAFSSFFSWWAIGAVFFASIVVAASVVAARV